MKIFLTALIATFFLAVFVNLAHAQYSSPSAFTTNPTTISTFGTQLANPASQAAALRAKLLSFRNKQKAAIVDRVNTNLANINLKRTEEMMRHLDLLSNIITTLETRVNAVTGKDTTSAKTAIAAAKVAIDSARQAVTAQQSKDYTITVTSETNVKADVLKERLALLNDLEADHQLIVAARQAVAAAISATAELGGISNGQ